MKEPQPSGPCLRSSDHIWRVYEDTPTLRRLRCIRGKCTVVTSYPKVSLRPRPICTKCNGIDEHPQHLPICNRCHGTCLEPA